MKEDKSPKQRLLEAAYELFGQRDPADVSVRELAKKANVNIASINYHFGSKEGLYMSLLENITQYMQEKTASFIEIFENKRKNIEENKKETQQFYIEMFIEFVEYVARTIFARLQKDNFIHTIVLREQMHPTPAFSLLYEKGMKNIFLLFDDFLSHIDTKSPPQTIKLRTHIIFGQIIIFVATYATFSKRLETSYFSDENIEEIITLIKQHTQVIIQSFVKGV